MIVLAMRGGVAQVVVGRHDDAGLAAGTDHLCSVFDGQRDGIDGRDGVEGQQGIPGAGLNKDQVIALVLDMRRRGSI